MWWTRTGHSCRNWHESAAGVMQADEESAVRSRMKAPNVNSSDRALICGDSIGKYRTWEKNQMSKNQSRKSMLWLSTEKDRTCLHLLWSHQKMSARAPICCDLWRERPERERPYVYPGRASFVMSSRSKHLYSLFPRLAVLQKTKQVSQNNY